MITTIIYCHTHFSYGKGRGAVALEEMELPRGFVAFIFAFEDNSSRALVNLIGMCPRHVQVYN